jgi:hypothetical protein
MEGSFMKFYRQNELNTPRAPAANVIKHVTGGG